MLIIGANSYIARHFTHILHQNQFHTILCDIHDTSKDGHSNYFTIDIRKKDSFHAIDFKVDYLFLFSSLTGTKASFQNYQSFLEVNELGLLNILNHIKKVGSKVQVIFPSTRLVYKGQKGILLKEGATKEFKTPYAMNKFACENYLKIYKNYHNINYTIFRICVPYGNILDNIYSYGTLGFMLNKALNKENITLYGDGSQKRTFTHVLDICKVILAGTLLPEAKNNTFNIGSLDQLSLLEVAQQIAQKYNIEISFQDWPPFDWNIESGDTMFDDTKLQTLLSYKYEYTLEKWIGSLS